jgi:hypothetical protein
VTRHLVDDGAFASLPGCTDLAGALRDFHEILTALEREGQPAGMTRGWAAVTVGSSDLGSFLMAVGPDSKDAAMLAMLALDHCVVWDDDPSLFVDPSVMIDGIPYESYAVARCVEQAGQHSRVVACITVGETVGAGLHRAGPVGGDATEVCFLVTAADRPLAARHRIRVEARGEAEFFALTKDAFPVLRFADGVTFKKFEGTFLALRDEVLRHLSALNDRFSATYGTEQGDLRRVSALLGIDMSIEGGTRSSEKLMSHRDAHLDGRVYRCEIHTKIEPHRNRIHFYPGDEHTGGHIVIGHFVRHLPT